MAHPVKIQFINKDHDEYFTHHTRPFLSPLPLDLEVKLKSIGSESI